ncbi:zinc carboxypeptidase-like [Sitodiplosis mosellana]|uniref:zinc carboxypeptidase-like n=1 Tax=Sitodiplosis mosellana TaxID=263140 RepID=UPI002443E5C8|nr:zinc carboxypeptidase-like [Sitodiplosis mosellana]
MKAIVFVILSVSVASGLGEKARFDNYRVYSIEVENNEQLQVLKELENQQNGLLFLAPPTATQTFVELIVPPHKFADISELCEKFRMKNDLKIDNLQRLIDEEQPSLTTRAAYGWKQYHTIDEIYDWLDQMTRRYPRELTNYNIGKTYEKRNIRAVKLSHNPERKNPTIFIESTIHAREWITVATATYVLNELLTSNDPEVREMATKYDWVFVPVANPDGYVYSHSSNRMWRKTRKPQRNSCFGVDANRNFAFHHAATGGSTNPCSETYAGAKAFSEPETLALAEFIKSFDNIRLYLSFHSYGQMLLFPYGHSKNRAVNFNSLNQIGIKAKEAIQKRYGAKYSIGSIAEVLYLASGTSIDWVHATQSVPLAFTFEFRDSRNGRYGFVLPASQIIPNALETMDGLKAMLKEAKLRQYL